MPKRKTETDIGQVEYETVICDSCEQEVVKNEAVKYVSGEIVEYHDWGALGKEEFNFNKTNLHEGWICPMCREQPALLTIRVPGRIQIPLTPPVTIALVALLLIAGVLLLAV